MFDKLVLTDNAKIAQIETMEYMVALGYKCHLEHPMIKANGGNGRIDIVCYKGNETVAIEVDNRRPRINSINKLKHFKATKKYVICRNLNILEIKGCD